MKKITKYLIIPLFSLFVFFFMFNTANVSAAVSGGDVVDPGDNAGGAFIPGTSEEELELYEQCTDYITTNIISAESLTEALNGKIYGNFTQEDCMEMINIASKREVIKNVFNQNEYVTDGFSLAFDISNLEIGQTYTFSSNLPIYWFKISDSSGGYNSLVKEGYNLLFSFTMSRHKEIPSSVTQYLFISVNPNNIYDAVTDISQLDGYNLQIEKGSTATPYVSYDYHREYYQEGIDYADNRVNTNSTSYTQGVTDADNRINKNSLNYKQGVSEGYDRASKDGKVLGNFIPTILGGFGSLFLTIFNIDVLGFNLLSIFGIAITIGIIIIILKFARG